MGRAASGKGDEDRKAVLSRKAASMAVRAAWFSSVMLETMPIKSGIEEGTWSDMLKASEWGRAGAWWLHTAEMAAGHKAEVANRMRTRNVCLGHVMTRLLESRREPVMLPNAQRSVKWHGCGTN